MCTVAAFADIDMAWVSVGDAGNAADIHGEGYGAVGREYCIGTYEVTNTQYASFLNAVAATGDANGLYNADMGGGWNSIGGIARTGAGTDADPWVYTARASRESRPVNYVSWYDALRFANWMHNGCPVGTQDETTTENGAYNMSLGASVTRNPDALVFLPTQDEWYKAAYYKGGGLDAGYWDYPTQSDAAPTAEAPPGTDMTNGSVNQFKLPGGYIDPTYFTTEVGAYTAKPSDSAYGTFDQGGNVWEWNESVVGGQRGMRGGSFSEPTPFVLSASACMSSDPSNEPYGIGFRVAMVPEPAAGLMLLLTGVVAIRRQRA
jgi:formylglycine-generating enzyme required for sulfatase activity